MTIARRTLLQLAALPLLPRLAHAQTYPARPVRIVIGLPAGSSPDIGGRLIAQWLSERLGQQFIVDNRPGADANLATEQVARAAGWSHASPRQSRRTRSTPRSMKIFVSISPATSRLSRASSRCQT